jgi:hypothetical protein
MSINHYYKRVALKEFGQGNPYPYVFSTEQAVDYLNTYKNLTGSLHKRTQTTNQQTGNLLSMMKSFKNMGYKKWMYIGEKE